LLCFVFLRRCFTFASSSSGRPETTKAALQAQIKRRTQHRFADQVVVPGARSRHSLSSRRVITMRMSERAGQKANPLPPLVADTA
jgi:hypothetical protein